MHARAGRLQICSDVTMLPLSALDHRKLEPPVVTFRYFAGGREVKKDGGWHVECVVEEFLPLSFCVVNRDGGETLDAPELCVHAYQDGSGADGGIPCTDLGGRILWSGALTERLPAIAPGQSATHQLQACFLAAGTYRLCVSCRVAATGGICWSQSPVTVAVADRSC